MDAAAAAAMSDPECNRHFRRRWGEAEPALIGASLNSSPAVGTLGLALQAAMERRRRDERLQMVAVNNGDPPR